MHAATERTAASRTELRTGRILTGIAVAFLLWDSVIKLLVLEPVREGLARLGYPVNVALGIGIVELVCLVVYLVPRTAIPGAVLLTGFLGGAVATHVRVGDPLFTHVLFPIYVATLLWGGLYLRDARLRAVVGRGNA
jgi:hypothetical protein